MPGKASHSCPTVLIVEDSEGSATTLEVAFSGIPGICVVMARNAPDALQILERDKDVVCALVTDLNMPRMDGFELIERVRGNGRHGKLPIIVVSGDIDPETPHRIARLGADAFFSKPYSPAQVRQKLEQLLNDYRRCA